MHSELIVLSRASLTTSPSRTARCPTPARQQEPRNDRDPAAARTRDRDPPRSASSAPALALFHGRQTVGKQFLFFGLLFTFIAGMLAMLIRWQLAFPTNPTAGLVGQPRPLPVQLALGRTDHATGVLQPGVHHARHADDLLRDHPHRGGVHRQLHHAAADRAPATCVSVSERAGVLGNPAAGGDHGGIVPAAHRPIGSRLDGLPAPLLDRGRGLGLAAVGADPQFRRLVSLLHVYLLPPGAHALLWPVNFVLGQLLAMLWRQAPPGPFRPLPRTGSRAGSWRFCWVSPR